MTEHSKKSIGPALAAILIISYYLFVGAAMLFFKVPNIVKIGAAVSAVIVTALSVFVLAERIKEIRSGEEDDLGEY